MRNTPKQTAAKLQMIIDAWRKLRPTKQFAGMTVDEFEAKVKPSLDTRGQLSDLRKQVTDSRLQRVDADSASLGLSLCVVNSVKGDPTEGENSGLYAAMGYTPKSQKRSGLTRKGQTTPSVETAVTNVTATATK